MCFTYDAIRFKSPPNNYTLKYLSELNQVSYSLLSFLNEKLAYEVAILTVHVHVLCVCVCARASVLAYAHAYACTVCLLETVLCLYASEL
jgi:hypothetical protein